MGYADLHAHTTASDGSLSPTELVRLAANTGLAGLAVTDHDTTTGLQEASAAAQEAGIAFVPGVELSMKYEGHFHLLGYFIRPGHPGLDGRLAEIRQLRDLRNAAMVGKMNDLGLRIDLEEVESEAGGEVVGRPHMAMVLQKKGYVGSTQEAFDRFLTRGAPCYVPKAQLTPEEGIALVRAAGGVPTVAHPFTLHLEDAELERRLLEWRDHGLGGLECYYPAHSVEQTVYYLRLAERLRLVPTGGSDFHGASKPQVRLGCVYQGQGIPTEMLNRLRAAAG